MFLRVYGKSYRCSNVDRMTFLNKKLHWFREIFPRGIVQSVKTFLKLKTVCEYSTVSLENQLGLEQLDFVNSNWKTGIGLKGMTVKGPSSGSRNIGFRFIVSCTFDCTA